MYDVLIIGGGIIGAAAAYELSKYRLNVALLEKENDIANGTTKANSAILHAGYDPKPGTRMAKLNVEGSRLAKELCLALDVPYRQCGSMVVAFSPEDLPTLQKLYEQGLQNGVEKLSLLSGEEARRLEPNLSEAVTGALLAETAAICSPWELTLAMAETAVKNGLTLFRDSAVTRMERLDGHWNVYTQNALFESRFVINAAGVHSGEVHDMAAPHSFSILPKRGEYYLLDKSEGGRVNHVIFQCPTKAGKGVLVAPTVHGNLIVGPSADDCAGPDDLATTASGLSSVAKAAKRSVPSVELRECIRSFAGIRAVADCTDDFIIGEATDAPGFFDLAGIKSPGLSAAAAIGVMAAGLLKDAGLALSPKADFSQERKRVRFSELSPEEKKRLTAENPLYGRVICRCEGVTEGEIMDALASPVPPVSVDGVKRRCGAGMGRCQGGFCGPRVVELLSRELGKKPTQIMQDKAGSQLLYPAREE